MRKLLLGTTALAAAVAFAAPAFAQNSGIDVTVGGYNEFFFAFYDADVDDDTGREFQLETEVVVRADGTAENGLTYGSEIQLRNDAAGAGASNLGVDESWVYVGGTWGQLRGGDLDGAEDELAVFFPAIGGVDALDGDYVDFLPYDLPSSANLRSPSDGDSTKVMYITPSFSGFQAAVNYTPETGDAGQSVVFDNDESLYHDWVAGGVSYNNTFGEFTVEASGTFSTASGSNDIGVEDFFGWAAGLRVGYAGFTLGGGYNEHDDFGLADGVSYEDDDQNSWNVGLSYANGPFAVVGYYQNADGVVDSVTTSDYDVYGISTVYNVAPGLTVSGEVDLFDYDIDDASTGTSLGGADGWLAVVSTAVSF